MRDGYRIADADRHVIEPVEMWKTYLPPAFVDRAPHREAPGARETLAERAARLGAKALLPVQPPLLLDGEPIMSKFSELAQVETSVARLKQIGQVEPGDTAQSHLRNMDRLGIDTAFLYPTFTHYLIAVDTMDPLLASAFAGAHNRWLRDYCAPAPDRLRGVGVISLHEPATMVTELERVAGFGWKAVVIRPNPVKGRGLGDPLYEPFWTACERLSIAVGVHEGTHARLPTAGADRFETRFAQHACSHPMEQMIALLALIEGGVLERHPLLRVAFLEAGCGFIPYWLWRLDELEYKHLAGEVAENVRRKPSEYFRRQCFVAVEPGEPYLPELLRFIGEDNLLFGTDFPHLDHTGDILDEVLALSDRLPGGALRKLLWDNPARFYGLDG